MAQRRDAPRYISVARSIVADIELGHYAVGTQLPTEPELQKRFGVSRHTIREAIRELRDMGVISVRHGLGTWVTAKPGAPNFVHGANTIEDLLLVTRQTRMEVVGTKTVRADQEMARFLDCAPGSEWLEISLLRFMPAYTLPIAYLKTYIPPAFAAVVPLIDNSNVPIFRLISQMHGQHVSEIRQEITSISLSDPEATALETQPGHHALQVVRRYLNAEGTLTQVTIGQYPGGRFTHTATFHFR